MSAPRPEVWIKATSAGLYCEPGSFYIDPLRPVPRAVITHGHGDHARPGNDQVLATPGTIAIMRERYGEAAGGSLQALSYGETVISGDVTVRLVPAGHVLGSAQVVLEYRGSRIVVSGDYKRRPDPTCAPLSFALAMSLSRRRPLACPCSAIRRTLRRSTSCCIPWVYFRIAAISLASTRSVSANACW